MSEENNHAVRKKGSARRKKRNRAKHFFIIFILMLFFVGVGYVLAVLYMPNFSVIQYYNYFGSLSTEEFETHYRTYRHMDAEEEITYNSALISQVNKDHTQIVFGSNLELLNNHPVINDGIIYLPVDFVKDYIDKYVFWDEAAQKLTITTEQEVMRITPEDTTYYVNMEPISLNLPFYNLGGIAYMPQGFIEELYDITMDYNAEYNTVVIQNTLDDLYESQVSAKKTRLRFLPNIKSPSMEILPQGTKLYVYESSEGFVKVRTEKGLIGYVEEKSIGNSAFISGYSKKSMEPDYTKPSDFEGKISLAWENMTTWEANNNESTRIVHNGLDILSPTWFKFDRDSYNGDMFSIADMDYVNWAHRNNYQVWPLISDEEDGEITAQILSDTAKREHIINQILAYVSIYKLDGINIDFERVREEDVLYFHQFLRELYPMLKLNNVTLSVDTFVPSAWSKYYDRGEIAKAADYVCVMTYDENTYGGTSGPNASIDFVEQGILDTINEGVPPEKLMMGVPFYSRVWIESVENGEVKYKIRSLGMDYAYKLFTENGAKFEWQEDLGCFYGEYDTVEEGVSLRYRVWLEDESSMAEKLKLVHQYDLAGVAAWVRGLEKEAIWDLFEDTLR